MKIDLLLNTIQKLVKRKLDGKFLQGEPLDCLLSIIIQKQQKIILNKLNLDLMLSFLLKQ